jgi:hypothetical protein
MDGQWLTYRQIAVRLGISVEAARRRALRGKWARMAGNDGMTRVMLPDDWRPPGTPDVRTDNERASSADAAIIKALQEHVQTLKEQLAAAEARLTAADARDAQHVADLAAERAQTEKANRRLFVSGGAARCTGGRARKAVVAPAGGLKPQCDERVRDARRRAWDGGRSA